MPTSLVVHPQVAKTAQTAANYRRPCFGFPSARDAFQGFIAACGLTAKDNVLLPSFIGWSAREGSGVFDPIVNTGVQPVFYRMTADLQIDVDDAMRMVRETAPRMMVLIHYFGYPDPQAAALAEFARAHDVVVIEDEAHAMLTDLVGGACGRWGDAAFISMHKMLPFPDGGSLLLNPTAPSGVQAILRGRGQAESRQQAFWDYDLSTIAQVRRRNAEELLAALPALEGRVRMLQPALPEGVVPQTLPVVIMQKDRNAIYFKMNECGFGVVSLYHTMIDRIRREAFPEAHQLAATILNLPVHQDIQPGQMTAMLDLLRELV